MTTQTKVDVLAVLDMQRVAMRNIVDVRNAIAELIEAASHADMAMRWDDVSDADAMALCARYAAHEMDMATSATIKAGINRRLRAALARIGK